MLPRGLLVSEGTPLPAARAGGSLPWGSVSAGHGAAGTGTGWLAAWGDASSLGCSIVGGRGGPGVELSHRGGTLSAEGAMAAGVGDTGCPDGVTAGGMGRSCCRVLLSAGDVTAGGQTGCLEGVTAAGTGEMFFSEVVMAGGTGETVFSEGTVAGGTGRSCWGGVRSPCRAPPGEGGGGATLSPIRDGGFPATQEEQSKQSLSAGAGSSPITPKHSPREQGAGDSPHVPRGRQRDPHPSPPAAPVSGGTHAGARHWVHNAQRDRPGLCQAPLPQSHPSSPSSCHAGPATGGRGDQHPTQAWGPTCVPTAVPGGCAAASAGTRGAATGRMGAGPAA